LSSPGPSRKLGLCYGRPDFGKEAKDVFCQVDIEGAFLNLEMAELHNLEKRIDQIGGGHGPLKDISGQSWRRFRGGISECNFIARTHYGSV
jgi:farnesyl diphosphate synthase